MEMIYEYLLDPTLAMVLRWLHIVAAIAWIGQTWLFNWMESNLVVDEGAGENSAGTLWMVHGGGFYLVEKQKHPEIMPKTLHWFKWEAAFTWITGMLLLFVIYYLGEMICGEDQNFTHAVLVGIASIIGSWIVYDVLLMFTPLGKNPYVFGVVAFLGLLGLSYGLCQMHGSRSAFIHVGAVIGTIMVANVWMRILPSQRKMIKAAEEGKKPDPKIATIGPMRSRHNSFMSVPMVLIMISNHYPHLYGHEYNWLLLGAMILLGWGISKVLFVAKHKKVSS